MVCVRSPDSADGPGPRRRPVVVCVRSPAAASTSGLRAGRPAPYVRSRGSAGECSPRSPPAAARAPGSAKGPGSGREPCGLPFWRAPCSAVGPRPSVPARPYGCCAGLWAGSRPACVGWPFGREGGRAAGRPLGGGGAGGPPFDRNASPRSFGPFHGGDGRPFSWGRVGRPFGPGAGGRPSAGGIGRPAGGRPCDGPRAACLPWPKPGGSPPLRRAGSPSWKGWPAKCSLGFPGRFTESSREGDASVPYPRRAVWATGWPRRPVASPGGAGRPSGGPGAIGPLGWSCAASRPTPAARRWASSSAARRRAARPPGIGLAPVSPSRARTSSAPGDARRARSGPSATPPPRAARDRGRVRSPRSRSRPLW